MSFEGRWRALTIARLWGHCGWRLSRIGKHFGFGAERARQLVKVAGCYGERGEMRSLDPTTWPQFEPDPGHWEVGYNEEGSPP
jgi:hypothetical protein